MGCDIHMIAEIQSKSGESIIIGGGVKKVIPPQKFWSKMGRVFLNQYYDPTETAVSCWGNNNEPVVDEPWQERWYLLFSVLANVRNSWDVKPISEPRGIPEDASEETKQWLEEADHSFSWLTLRELLTFKWDEPFLVEDKWCSLSEFNFTIKQLKRIAYGLKLKEDEIRIVFGFDN